MVATEINQKKDKILQIAQKHGVLSVKIFGSFARGDECNDSDVDLLITVGPHHSRWFPGGLVLDLEELLGRRVDVVEEDALPEDLKIRLLQEAISL